MFHTSNIEISRSAYQQNLNFLKEQIGKGVKISSVVKGNAYGHGIEMFVPLAEDCGIEHFSVFSADEALRVRQAGKGLADIMIMGSLENEELEWAIHNGIEFFVFEQDRLEAALKIAKKIQRPAKLHIELETGMNRTGFAAQSIKATKTLLLKHPEAFEIKGLCTHYAGAESIANYFRIKKQKSVFNKLKKQFAAPDLMPEALHTACSAAAIRYPETQMDMVRIGILQYGFFPSQEVLIEYLTRQKKTEYPLKRLISWKTKVMDVKQVKAGEFIGYGTSFLASNDMSVASIPVGYSHGFSRSLSNQGRVLIHGQRTSVVGTVNMNMTLVDITNLEGVKKGDEVVLIGYQGDLEISVSSFGNFSDQLNYELLTRLPSNIPRKVIE
ncbi:MAG: alanine racemase [Saprospiraceae bacterium]